MRVILYVMRNTWGFGEFGEYKNISMDEFIHGRKRRDGSRLDAGCQMSETSLRDGLHRAQKHGFIHLTVSGDNGRIHKGYALVLAPGNDEEGPPSGRQQHPLRNNGGTPSETEGVRDQKLRGTSSVSGPRSEKETLKETKKEGEAASKRQPAAPPPGLPAAIQVFWKSRGRLPTPRQQTQIIEAVGDKPADLEFWGKVLDAYEDAGWNPKSVSGPLDYYGRREIPSALKNAKGRDGSRAQKKRDIRKYWDDKLKGRQAGPDEKGSTE